MAEKNHRKDLKAPDPLQRVGVEAQSWLQDNGRLLWLAAAAVLLLGAGVALSSYLSDRKEAQTAQAFGALLRVLERPVAEDGKAEEGNPSAGPPFKSQREKDEAVVKAFEDFRKGAKGEQADLAGLPLAAAHFRLGNVDAALNDFKAYVKGGSSGDVLRFLALEGEGYAQEAKGQWDAALEAFDRMAKENNSEFLVGMGLYHRGRILIRQNKKEEAAGVFSQVTSAHPNTAAARLAADRLALLAEEGIKPPPKPAETAAGTQPKDAG